MKIKTKLNQIVGNIGLFYICYELCKRGWNAMPTSRNAKGVDIIIYNQDATKKYTIQSKSLSRRSPVPLGISGQIIADYLVICRNVFEIPEIFITTFKDIESQIHRGERAGKISYWLQPKDYEGFKNNWELIGNGF